MVGADGHPGVRALKAGIREESLVSVRQHLQGEWSQEWESDSLLFAV